MTAKSHAQDIADRLEEMGSGTIAATTGWAISVGREPLKPASAITVYDTGGGEPDTDEQDLLTPTFQIRVRAKSYQEAFDKQRSIRDHLIRMAFSTAGGRYLSIKSISSILSLGQDEKNLHVLSANYEALFLAITSQVTFDSTEAAGFDDTQTWTMDQAA